MSAKLLESSLVGLAPLLQGSPPVWSRYPVGGFQRQLPQGMAGRGPGEGRGTVESVQEGVGVCHVRNTWALGV